MYRYLFLLLVVFFSNTVFASEDLFSGKFSHDFATLKDDPLWQINFKADGFELHRLTDQLTTKLHPLSTDERDQFWQRMMWPLQSNEKAQCIGNNYQIICYVPTESRQEIHWLANNKSDYFYYDRMFGVTEIFRDKD